MCQESLIEYLVTKLDIPEITTYNELGKGQTQMFDNEAKRGQLPLLNAEKTPLPGITRADIERFIKQKETTPQIIANAKEINKHLDDVKICDPAIGSGAFPMGLLLEIFHTKQILKESAEVTGLRSVSNADMKEGIIQNSIYGVDIEKGAVDIARLRFWLSLIVDEELPRALPNLDFKIVVGDSLLPKLRVNDEEEIVDINWSVVLDKTDRSVPANKAKIEKLRTDISQLVIEQRKYFSVRTEKDKTKLKQTIRRLKIQILIGQLQLDKIKYSEASVTTQDMFGGGKKDTQEKQKKAEVVLKLAEFQKTIQHLEKLQKHPNELLRFFDWKLDFPEILNSAIVQREGFDIVIGNPPYISAIEFKSTHEESERDELKERFQTAKGAFDIYVPFIERSLTLLANRGVLTLINPNKYLSAKYAEALREYLLENASLIELLDVSGILVFEQVSVYPLVSIMSKEREAKRRISVLSPRARKMQAFDRGDFGETLIERNVLRSLPENIWGFLLSQQMDLLFKLIVGCSQLSDAASINASTTAGEADDYGAHITDKPSEGALKVINTGTIEKFYSLWGTVPLTHGGQKFMTPYLPLKRAGVNNRRQSLYRSPKLIFAKMGNSCEATYDAKGEYASLNTNCLYNPTDETSLGFFAGYCNSKLFMFFYDQFFGSLRMSGGYYQFQAPQLRVLPFRKPNKEIDAAVNKFVDKIRYMKERAPSADIKPLEEEIDQLVYQLFGLTQTEKLVIEQHNTIK